MSLSLLFPEEGFEIITTGTDAGSPEANFESIRSSVEDKEAAYLIIRSPNEGEEERWLLIFFIPMAAKVRDKMLFASSAASLKRSFGASHFIADYNASERDELTLEAYREATREAQKEELLTMDEIYKDEADIESAMMVTEVGSNKSLVDMPVKHTPEALQAIQDFAAGNLQTLLLNLDSETEVLQVVSTSNGVSLDETASGMEEKAPRYILHRWDHKNPKTGEQESHRVFIYYCPMRAPPRSKMFFSACKSMLVETCAKAECGIAKNIELSELSEISDKHLHEDFYPPEVEEKAVIKPKAVGRGRRKVGKFQA